jgi:site-specific recombinase XerD
MRAVKELVGHQDLTMTQPYSHLRPAALVDIILETLQRAR